MSSRVIASLSIGDYVLSGGELAAAVMVDAIVRLLPGVLGNPDSDSVMRALVFRMTRAARTCSPARCHPATHGAGGLLDYPHFTRPARLPLGSTVPAGAARMATTLKIRQMAQREQALAKTWQQPSGVAGKRCVPEW